MEECYEYYPIECETEFGSVFYIYCSGNEDYLINDGNVLILFTDLDGLIEFSKDKGLTPLLTKELTVYDF